MLESRRAQRFPWHSPPHRFLDASRQYIVSAACYEHAEIIGHTAKRMDAFSDLLLETCGVLCDQVFAWCVLPNHYHVVLQTNAVRDLLHALGRVHGRTSHDWNGEDCQRGRKVWFNAVEREMRSERHLWASINYVHNNPVKHGLVERWQDWPWSSARSFLEEIGRDKAAEIWREYPVRDYGEGWD